MQRNKRLKFIKAVLFFILAVVILYLFARSSWVQRNIYVLKYENHILTYSEEFDMDPYMVMAVIWVESKFNPNATSPKSARGLMQIMPDTGEWIAERMGLDRYDEDLLYEPEMSIMMGTWYLNNLRMRFNQDDRLMLAAYNGGSGNVNKWLNNPEYSKDGKSLDYIPFRETREYIPKVMDAYNQYRVLYPDIKK